MQRTYLNKMEEKNSKYGKGFTYCLGLFSAHAEREVYEDRFDMWFNASAEHLQELVIPNSLSTTLKARVKSFATKCIDLRRGRKATKDDIDWSIKEAKDILLEFDKHLGIDAVEAEWE